MSVMDVDLLKIGDKLNDLIIGIDNHNTVMYCNKSIEDFTQAKKDDIIGRVFDGEHMMPIFGSAFVEDISLGIQAKPNGKVKSSIVSNNNIHAIEASIVAFKEGIVVVINKLYDEQGHSESNDSKISNLDIFHLIDAAIYIHDDAGVFLDVNAGGTKKFGYPREAFIGKTPEFLAAPDMNNMEENMAKVRDAAKGNHNQLLFWGKRSDGVVIPVMVDMWGAQMNGKNIVVALTNDISDHYKTQIQLEQLKLHSETLLSALPDMMYIIDKYGSISEYRLNRSEDIPVLDESIIEGSSLSSIFNKEQYKEVLDIINDVIHNDEIVVYRYDLDVRGSQEFFEARFVRLDDLRVMAIVRNITALIKTMNALEQSEKKYKAVFEHSPFGVALLDVHLNVMSCNSRFINLIGLDGHSSETISLNDHIVCADFKDDQELLETVKCKGSASGTGKFVRNNDTFFWGHYSFSMIEYKEEDSMYIVLTLEDVTRVKQAEEWINHRLKLEKLLSKVTGHYMMANSFDEFMMTTLEDIGKGLNVSRTYLFKYDADTDFYNYLYEWCAEGIVTFIDKVDGYPGAFIQEFSDKLKRNENVSVPDVDRLGSEELQSELKGQDIYALQLCPVFINNVFYGMLGFDDCNLEREWTEEDLNLLRGVSIVIGHTLSHFDKEAEINNLLELSQKQNDRLLNFAHIVSHNLRNHSANISMLIELYNDEKDTSEKRVYWDMLSKASRLMNSTIEELNKVIKVNARAEEGIKAVSIHNIVDNVKNILQQQISETGADVQKNIPENISILAVPAYIESIFLNLISNAIRYRMPDRPLSVHIDYHKTPQQHIIKVKDNGVGIDLDKHGSSIFGMYKTFHDNEEAIGLGLFMTKNQIDAMGGSITVESAVHQGSTFIVKLPILKSIP